MSTLFHTDSKYFSLLQIEFLRNLTKEADRSFVDGDYFRVLSKFVDSYDTAYRICAASFHADGRDFRGLIPQKKKRTRAKPVATKYPRLHQVEFAFFEEDDDESSSDAWSLEDGPFAHGMTEGLNSIWVHTKGFEDLRRNILIFLDQKQLEIMDSDADDPVRDRFLELSEFLHLNPLETKIFAYSYLKEKGLAPWTPRHGSDTPRSAFFVTNVLGLLLGETAGANDKERADNVSVALDPRGMLSMSEAVDQWSLDIRPNMVFYIEGLFHCSVSQLFYAPYSGERLPWDFYPETMRKMGDAMASIIRANRGKATCNFLLYGVPGAGKTTFAAALAERVGMTAAMIAVSSEVQSMKSPEKSMNVSAFRLGSVCVTERSCPTDKTLLVIDEADGLFDEADASRLNAAFDKGCGIRIWICNSAPRRVMNGANLRRFDMSMAFRPLNEEQRLSVWRNTVRKQGLEKVLSERILSKLAKEYTLSPGYIARDVANFGAVLKAEGPSVATTEFLRNLLDNHLELMGEKTLGNPAAKGHSISKGYVLDGLPMKGNARPEDLLWAIRKHFDVLKGKGKASPDVPRLNVLLSGPPGCGKTEFVRWVGEQTGRKVRALRASDLFDKYVGETEKRIREAFEDAFAAGEILFLDEVDSLLANRQGAHMSWEVSQVNELLQSMESFGGVLLCATNFMDNLDPAVLRRFTFKLSFGYLDRQGKVSFFEKYFGPLTEAEEEALAAIPKLCPGDFRTVRQNFFYRRETIDNAARIQALREESRAKQKLSLIGEDDADKRHLGFMAAS